MNLKIQDLLESGVHLGHKLRRYNPKCKKFIFDQRYGISIIDIEKTQAQIEDACNFLERLVASGKDVLFIGTKKQSQETVREAATTCQMPFAVNRWMGGTLTNHSTIERSIKKYKKYMAMETDGTLAKLPKKEVSAIRREMSRMLRNFEGIVEMKNPLGAVFIIDTKNEAIALSEANRINLPVVALVDTNADPSLVDYPIIGNDDSTRSIRIIVESIVDAVQQGISQRKVQIQDRDNSSLKNEDVKEEQLPVTVPSQKETVEIPASFSTDVDENT